MRAPSGALGGRERSSPWAAVGAGRAWMMAGEQAGGAVLAPSLRRGALGIHPAREKPGVRRQGLAHTLSGRRRASPGPVPRTGRPSGGPSPGDARRCFAPFPLDRCGSRPDWPWTRWTCTRDGARRVRARRLLHGWPMVSSSALARLDQPGERFFAAGARLLGRTARGARPVWYAP